MFSIRFCIGSINPTVEYSAFAYFDHLEGFFDPQEWLESLRGVGEINFAVLDAPNGLTATRFSENTYLLFFLPI